MKIYLIDNYDSFTYNLYQLIGEILPFDAEIVVKHNDRTSLEEIREFNPDRIIISPGPGSPDNEEYFGICTQVIKQLGTKIPTLGICLGMQGIAHVFGGNIIHAKKPMHGKTSLIVHNDKKLFASLPNPLSVMRYHSLIVENQSLPECLTIDALTLESTETPLEHLKKMANKEGEIMALSHKDYPILGVQFHPESFLTEAGKELMQNFLFNF